MDAKKTLPAVLAVVIVLACCAGFAAPVAAADTDNFVIFYIVSGDLANTNLDDMKAFLDGWNPNNGKLLVFYGAVTSFGVRNDQGEFVNIADGIGDGMLIYDYDTLKQTIAESSYFLGINDDGEILPSVLGAIDTPMLSRAGLTEAMQYANSYAAENGLSNAKRTIIFNDHGGAYSGFGWDYTGTNTSTHLSNADIAYGLSQSDKKFDLIIFDACLMADLDVAYALKDTGRYLLGSQEISFGFRSIYPDIGKNITKDTVSYAKSIIDSYKSGDDTAKGKTLALIDLSKIDGLMAAVDAAGSLFASKLDDYNYFTVLGTLYAYDSQNGGVMKYGTEPENGDYLGFTFDLYQFMELIYQNNTNESVKAAAENVMNEIKNNVVLAEYHSNKKNPSHGISIASALHLQQSLINDTVTLSGSGWADFLNKFSEINFTITDASEQSGVTITNDAGAPVATADGAKAGTITTGSAHQFDAVSLTFLYTVNGKDIIVGDDPAKVEMTDGGDSDWISVPTNRFESDLEWDGCWYVLMNEDGTFVPVSLTYEYGFETDDGKEYSVYTMGGSVYRMIDGKEVGYLSYIDVLTDDETGEVVELELCSDTTAQNAWESTDVLAGDRFVPTLLIYDDNEGDITEAVSEHSFVFSENPIDDVVYVQLNPDDCSYLIEVDSLMDEGDASYIDPENPSEPKTAKTPAPLLGILLGLGAAGALLAFRRH